MAGTMDILIREMTIEDYDQVYDLWTGDQRALASKWMIHRRGWSPFLKRNPTTSVVAVQNRPCAGKHPLQP